MTPLPRRLRRRPRQRRRRAPQQRRRLRLCRPRPPPLVRRRRALMRRRPPRLPQRSLRRAPRRPLARTRLTSNPTLDPLESRRAPATTTRVGPRCRPRRQYRLRWLGLLRFPPQRCRGQPRRPARRCCAHHRRNRRRWLCSCSRRSRLRRGTHSIALRHLHAHWTWHCAWG